MKKKLKLQNLTQYQIDKDMSNQVYGGESVLCENTCDCSCSCDMNNPQQLNSNVDSTSNTNRTNSFVYVATIYIKYAPHF